MLTAIGPATPFTWLVAAYVGFGVGFGLVNAPITNAAVGELAGALGIDPLNATVVVDGLEALRRILTSVAAQT